MKKCDSCGKIITNDKEFMCPFCGAVAKKHCDHETHLNNKYYRYNDYNELDKDGSMNEKGYTAKRSVEDSPRSPAGYKDNVKKLMKSFLGFFVIVISFSVVMTVLTVSDDTVDDTYDYEEIYSEDFQLGPYDTYLEEFVPDELIDNSNTEASLTHYKAGLQCDEIHLNEEEDTLDITFTTMYYSNISSDDEYTYSESTDDVDLSGSVSAKAFYILRRELDLAPESPEFYEQRTLDLKGELTSDGKLRFFGVPSGLASFGEPVFIVIPHIVVNGAENNPICSSVELVFDTIGYSDGIV
ncbi:MAG: hypothetical protein IKC01_02220, partial [Clostridia bacterium]|nr:hypothetical protein [Clostridia bacterium]